MLCPRVVYKALEDFKDVDFIVRFSFMFLA